MPRRFALLGTVLLAAAAQAEEVEWKPAKPLPVFGPLLQAESAAARIGRPQELPFPRVLPDTVADGPRLAPPPVQNPPSVVILPRTAYPPIPVQGRPVAGTGGEQLRPYRPHPTPTARLMPPKVPDPTPVAVPVKATPAAVVPASTPPRSQAPSFRLPTKPVRR